MISCLLLLLLSVSAAHAQAAPRLPNGFTGALVSIGNVPIPLVPNNTIVVVAFLANATVLFDKSAQQLYGEDPRTQSQWRVNTSSNTCDTYCKAGKTSKGSACSVETLFSFFVNVFPFAQPVSGSQCPALGGSSSGTLWSYSDVQNLDNFQFCVDNASGMPVWLQVQALRTGNWLNIQFTSVNLASSPNPSLFTPPSQCVWKTTK